MRSMTARNLAALSLNGAFPVMALPRTTSPTESKLCYMGDISTLVVVSQLPYVINKKCFWIHSVVDMTPNKLQLIKDYLLLLPHNFFRVTAVYRRSFSKIVVFIGDKIYMIIPA
jgi:hypothetical protein